MAGGLKKRRKRTLAGSAVIDGVALDWELVSEPQWSNSGDGYKGLCVSVRVADEARRELIIEYPYPTGADGRRCRFRSVRLSRRRSSKPLSTKH